MCQIAAVHRERYAGDIARHFRGEENRRQRNILGRTDPTERDAPGEIGHVLGVLPRVGVERRRSEPRADRVDSDGSIGPSSIASAFVNRRTPPFEVVYAAELGSAMKD